MTSLSLYHPTPRSHVLEGMFFFLEKGTWGVVLLDVTLSYLEFNILGYFLGWQSFLWLVLCAILNPVVVILIFCTYMVYLSYASVITQSKHRAPDWSSEEQTNIRFNDKTLISLHKNKRIPMETAIEYYFEEKIDFLDISKVFYNRYELFTFVITMGHLKWFCNQFLGQLFGHSIERDAREVGDVYNRGNDFYNWFLGPSMVYTSAIFRTKNIGEEALEDAQTRKIRTTLDSIHLKPGEEILDIGCGWGTLVIYAAEHYNAHATGCTLAVEQVAWAKNVAEEHNVSDRCSWIVDDYRKIPEHDNNKKYDKITCLEMAEHVGIKNFQAFLVQIHSMLKDDGIFYIQMCGVRRTWSFEDLIWICFMGKYIFPGADASTPINWVLNQLERSGFEIHRVENTGIHYARTIELWHQNWNNSREGVVAKYGERWFRLWDVFLCWSYHIARQGTSAAYMMVCNKNMYTDQFSVANGPALNRTRIFVGEDVIGYQM